MLAVGATVTGDTPMPAETSATARLRCLSIQPLASAIIHAQNVPDCLTWGLVALAVQIVAYWLVRVLMPNLSARIASGEMAAALFLGAASLSAGIINAAAMTY